MTLVFTHTGDLVGGILTKRVVSTVQLRKSGKLWIDLKGNRYRQKDGYSADSDWALLNLDLDSVKPI